MLSEPRFHGLHGQLARRRLGRSAHCALTGEVSRVSQRVSVWAEFDFKALQIGGRFESNADHYFRRQAPRDLTLVAFVQTVIEEQVVRGLDVAQAVPPGQVNSLRGCESRGGLDRRAPVNREPGLEVR